jgi:ABC-type nitrate/sulfonate/bicarbonate transport system ATPase subunit
MLVLDDPFSALDEAVTGHIVQRLLGPRGLFRRMATTVLLISNSSKLTTPTITVDSFSDIKN